MAKKYRAARVGEEKISGTMKIYSLPHQKSNGPPLIRYRPANNKKKSRAPSREDATFGHA